MRKVRVWLIGIAVLLVICVLGALIVKYFGGTSFTQSIVIKDFNAKGLDWVELKNETSKPYPVDGLVLSDGDNVFPIPVKEIPANGTITLASSEAEGKLSKHVDAYWAKGDPDPWGFKEGEIILVYNSKDLSIADYRFVSEEKKAISKGVYKPSDIQDLLNPLAYINGIWSFLISLVGPILLAPFHIMIQSILFTPLRDGKLGSNGS